MAIWISIGVGAALILFFVTRVNSRLIKIVEPKVGFLNLLDESARLLLVEDRDAIRGSFYEVRESIDVAPQCDVLLIYCTVFADGSLHGTTSSLRQMIADSGAKIIIVATDNSVECYKEALKLDGEKANIVLTLDRRGWKFAHFMKQLFETMEKGLSMPVAWVRLAPQNPGVEHEDCPSTLFSSELGSVVFKRIS